MGFNPKALPIFKNDDTDFQLMQSNWASQLNPMLKNPLISGHVLKGISLVTGANVVNHKLGRALQGWSIVRQRSAGSVFDTQDSNLNSELTLTLTSSANINVDIYVF